MNLLILCICTAGVAPLGKVGGGLIVYLLYGSVGEFPVSEVATVFTLFKMTTPPSQNRHAKCSCVQHSLWRAHASHY